MTDQVSTSAVEIRNVVKRFGEFTALSNISFTIHRGEFFSLLGPSGCGKTTLLRILAGLEIADEGILKIAGQDAHDIPAHRRPVNTVFQSYALFPHMTVHDNVAFGLRMKSISAAEIEGRVSKVLDLVEIAALSHRKPSQLSGGQKQRVALARAVVNEPQVLLLDEPLGALDLKLRKQLQVELLNLQRRLGITFIYVTHDQEEALVMSDRIAVMNAGRIEQMDESEELYERPRTRFVSQFLGSCTLLDASKIKRTITGATVTTSLGDLCVDFGAKPSDSSRRDKFTLAIRPEKISLHFPGERIGENVVPVRIEQLIYVGAETHYLLRAGQQTLRVEAMNTKVGSQGFDVGQEVVAYLPPAGLIVLDD